MSHPSCTFRLGRVRSFEASKTGAACSSVWAKMSETKIGLRASDLDLGHPVVRCASGMKPSSRDRWVRTVKSDGPSRADVRGPKSELRSPACDFRQPMLVRVPDHRGHTGQSGDFFRRALRVAAGDHDLGFGILAMNAAHGGAGVLIGGGSYRAGVEDDDSGFGRLRWRAPGLAPGIGVQWRRHPPGLRGSRNFPRRKSPRFYFSVARHATRPRAAIARRKSTVAA